MPWMIIIHVVDKKWSREDICRHWMSCASARFGRQAPIEMVRRFGHPQRIPATTLA